MKLNTRDVADRPGDRRQGDEATAGPRECWAVYRGVVR